MCMEVETVDFCVDNIRCIRGEYTPYSRKLRTTVINYQVTSIYYDMLMIPPYTPIPKYEDIYSYR